ADTLAAAREARSYGCRVIAISNIVGSTLARETKDVLYTRAGPEIGVAATKTFTAQLVALLLLAILFAKFRGRLSADRAKRLLVSLRNIPGTIRRVLDTKELIEACANEFAGSSDYFFIGRGVNFPMALEGALKLKEISYIHAEGYAAGELKHGPLALITKGVPVVAIATRDSAYAKVLSNIKEVKAREASVIAIASEGDTEIDHYVDNVIRVPQVDELLAPLLTAVVLQLLAYCTARVRNCPIDRPRNLAKSVTVE
ncbi:MAG TPA: SIS domain-containing protein, partial [Candidatus Methanoperedenaceae archaeon]|nr:SIS domain-containing protein [Candidatus Methanoperedenaceae archaeon]